jgi:excisionase family DNA binding protein
VPEQATEIMNSGQFSARSLSIEQATQALRVSRRTLYYWIKRGRVQTVRTSMGSQRVLVASVKSGWVERN